MLRVITYIDGFNLYFGMKAEYNNKYLWLDVEALSNSLLAPGQTLVATKYFTSMVANQPTKEKRQRTYLDALKSSTNCSFFYGMYQPNIIHCRSCGSNWPAPKEKMTDVNIATQMLMDAFTDQFDVAILLSGDSDLVPPIHAIKRLAPQKRIGVYFPPRRHSIAIQKAVDFSGLIGKKKLRECQMPDDVVKPDGFILSRPVTWI